MEDHVGRVLTAAVATVTATAATVAFCRCLVPGSLSEHWAAFAGLLGLLAATVGLTARPGREVRRGVCLTVQRLAGLAGLVIVVLLLGQTLWLIGHALVTGSARYEL